MEGGATSPTGIFLLITAFICDIINFIPVAGPIISVIIMGALLFIFKDQLGFKKEQSSQENQEQTEGEQEMAGQDTKKIEEKKESDSTMKGQEAPPPKKELPTTSSKASTPKTNKASVATDLAKGDIKGFGKKLGRNFLIDLIPVVGPLLASYTIMVWRML